MSGRYAFSVPEPRQRDGWFRIGTIDVTTTAFLVFLGIISMFVYAISPEFVFAGAFSSFEVRQGEVWRLVTWPAVDAPSIWSLISLVVFWYFGHMVEERIGRKPMAMVLLAMAVVPTTIVTLLNVTNEIGLGRWDAFSFSISLFSLAMIVIFAMQNPTAKFFFGIPAWVLAGVFVLIQVLQYTAERAWAQLILTLLVIVVGCIGVAQRGMLEDYSFIPRSKALAGSGASPYGEMGSARPKQKKRRRASKRRGDRGSVVAGPWDSKAGPTPLEQAELDVLLDRISDGGIESLTKAERARLNDLSKRMRGS
jgi:membrane associated rhomboid family serine protease